MMTLIVKSAGVGSGNGGFVVVGVNDVAGGARAAREDAELVEDDELEVLVKANRPPTIAIAASTPTTIKAVRTVSFLGCGNGLAWGAH
jgi:hypothetical protein